MAEAGEAIERMLLEGKVVTHASEGRRRVLACIACHLCRSAADGTPQRVHANDIKKCAGTDATHLLRTLESAGVFTEELDLAHHVSGPVSRFLAPIDTPIGQAFFDRANAPDTCFSGHELPPLTPSAHTSPEPTS